MYCCLPQGLVKRLISQQCNACCCCTATHQREMHKASKKTSIDRGAPQYQIEAGWGTLNRDCGCLKRNRNHSQWLTGIFGERGDAGWGGSAGNPGTQVVHHDCCVLQQADVDALLCDPLLDALHAARRYFPWQPSRAGAVLSPGTPETLQPQVHPSRWGHTASAVRHCRKSIAGDSA